MKQSYRRTLSFVLAVMLLLTFRASADDLPDPDGKPADMTKPVQVYILLGQSNMLGFGKTKGGDGSLEHAVKEKKLYSYLVNDDGDWTERKDVRNVRVMGSGTGGLKQFNNEWMTIKGKIGPEIGIGHHLGHAIDAPVMILKSCIGNRALGWDLLPPGSEGHEFTDDKGVTWVHPGYKGTPERWKKGTEPKKITWYAGMQYDGDIARAKQVLKELDKYYPDATGYEIAGFFWWQGDRDSRTAAHASRYEKNLVHLIKQLRKDFNAPQAKFVCATLGQTEKGATDNGGKILDAMFAVNGESGKYAEFKNNVAAVYSHPLSKGGSSGSHYGGNAETYMNVGEAMGQAMVKLINPSAAATNESATTVTPLRQAHAHNDYLHERPLLDALEQGFCSVEADIFLVDGELLVAHTRRELSKGRTLRRLYLDPLRERVKQNGGRVYRDGPVVTLLIDFKNDGAATYQALDKLLAEYPEVFSVVKNGNTTEKAVNVVISGDRPFEAITADTERYAGIDGRLTDLDSDKPVHLLPMISDRWGSHFKWRGEGEMTAEEKEKLASIVEKAHDKGRLLRFWAIPDKPSAWKTMQQAGVDLINTDDLAGLSKMLRE